MNTISDYFYFPFFYLFISTSISDSRFGSSTSEALRTLWQQGGISRLYQGLPFALLQGKIKR